MFSAPSAITGWRALRTCFCKSSQQSSRLERAEIFGLAVHPDGFASRAKIWI
jgi:hypothetical protein